MFCLDLSLYITFPRAPSTFSEGLEGPVVPSEEVRLEP